MHHHLKVHKVDSDTSTEYFITGVAGGGPAENDAGQRLFEELALVVEGEGIDILSEKIYGTIRRRDQNLTLRASAFSRVGLECHTPVTYVEGKPVHGAALAGLQMWGIKPKPSSSITVSTVDLPFVGKARQWTDHGRRFVLFSSVRGVSRDGTFQVSRSKQAQKMYENAAKALETLGMSISNIVRTWIYIADILDWYDDFNHARTRMFQRFGLLEDLKPPVFPASTGIQGRSTEGACLMDVLAVDCTKPSKFTVQPITRTERQPEANTYGSAFSRGVVLAVGDRKTIHVSGTASIDRDGRTQNVGDPDGQARDVFRNISALLTEHGATVDDIRTATVFVKGDAAYSAYERVRNDLGMTDFPAVCVIADVCRPDLLVEIEAVAAM